MSPQKAYYALFEANPAGQPPFSVFLGTSDGDIEISDCQHIPDAIEKIKIALTGFSIQESFTLIYPIYMEAMGSDDEMTMHSIAHLILEASQTEGWAFGRVGGLTGLSPKSYIK